jgi:hypothetical protein
MLQYEVLCISVNEITRWIRERVLPQIGKPLPSSRSSSSYRYKNEVDGTDPLPRAEDFCSLGTGQHCLMSKNNNPANIMHEYYYACSTYSGPHDDDDDFPLALQTPTRPSSYSIWMSSITPILSPRGVCTSTGDGCLLCRPPFQ